MAKKENIRRLFNNIAPKYDFLNHLLSFNIDKIWRCKAIKYIKKQNLERVLDIACGTGDFSFLAVKHGAKELIGVDISENMFNIATEKATKKGVSGKVSFRYGDSEQLEFPDGYFSAVIVAFGVRNFENLSLGLSEMYRVLRSGGQVVILEFSRPDIFPMKQLYGFYFKNILPRLGGAISGDKSAYEYLPNSVLFFPQGEEFLELMSCVGFTDLSQKRLTFGISTIYVGAKA
jgi:demethylmenaquinone methyltransferase/2-methoxy-6-polyprenyl-1,4-benzoquinol methylase